MLKKILSVSGKPGLYKMISQGKNMLIIESLIDKKRLPAYAKDKVISLGDISIYTNEEDIPLYEVLNNVKEKEGGKKVSLDLNKQTPDDLRAYLAEVLPTFDRDRVYPTDIKRLLNWYNILLGAGITDFDPQEEKEEKAEEEKEASEAKKTDEPKKITKTRAKSVTATTPKKTSSKVSVGKTTQRTRQK